MRRRLTYAVVTSVLLAVSFVAQQDPVAASGSPATWSTVQRLAGASSVVDGVAKPTAPLVDCSSVGDCSMASSYYDSNDSERAYLDTEVSGSWTHAVNPGGVTRGSVQQQILGMSCGAPGNCLAIGTYTTPAEQASFFEIGTPFISRETGGIWRTAIDVPGLLQLDPARTDFIDGVSCYAANSCTITGMYYTDSTFDDWTASEVRGQWTAAVPLPGQSAAGLTAAGFLEEPIDALSCGSAGNCILGGYFFNGSTTSRGFDDEEVSGIWGPISAVPGLDALDVGSGSIVSAASCSSPGNCSIGGTYLDGNEAPQAFVATESAGTWGNALEAPGTGELNAGGGAVSLDVSVGAQVQTIDCPSDGNCTAVGWYESAGDASDLFVDSEVQGDWTTAVPMPGMVQLNAGANLSNDGAAAAGLTCFSAGNCEIAGNYVDSTGNSELFTEDEAAGTFQTATELPIATTAPAGFPDAFSDTVDDLSCVSPGNCELAGVFSQGGFVTSELGGTWTSPAAAFTTSPTVYVGTNAAVDLVQCPAAGSCAAVGEYQASDGMEKPFFARQSEGTWRPDELMSDLAAFAPMGFNLARFTCSTVDHCTLIGSYVGSDGQSHLFYEREAHGVWQPPQAIKGLPTAPKGTTSPYFDGASWSGIACTSAVDCVGTGSVSDGLDGRSEPFIVTQSDGHWSTSLRVGGIEHWTGRSAPVDLSCPTVTTCTIVGLHSVLNRPTEMFVLAERGGTWGTARILTSPSSLSSASGDLRGVFGLNVSCTDSGEDCAVSGYVTVVGEQFVPFVLSEWHGHWERATLIPGFHRITSIVPASAFDDISITALQCTGPGNCVLLGTYPADYDNFFTSETSSFIDTSLAGRWSRLQLLAPPPPVKSRKATSTFYFEAMGIACPRHACAVIGTATATIAIAGPEGSTYYQYYDAVFHAAWTAAAVGRPTRDTRWINSDYGLFDPWSIFAVSCGATSACAVGGSVDTGGSTVPVVMTSV